MTEKLYEKDAYLKKFSAVIKDCHAEDGNYYIKLDKTAFFPEGGGQGADCGTINGAPVLDVQQKGDIILHTLQSELKIGDTVECEVDWNLRYSRMQGHTGEHILSGIVHSLYGYDNVGFHMSESIMLVDFNGPLTPEDIKKVEIEANKAIYTNADIVAFYPSPEEIETLQFRSKKDFENNLRVVSIGENIDHCACCAPHVAKTGEVGIIKIVDFYSYKQGTRIEMTAGINALKDYMDINTSVKELMKILSAPRDGIVDAVSERNTAYQTLKNDYQKISKRLALLELPLCELNGSVYSFGDNLSFDDLRYCANQLTDNKYNICILLSKKEAGGYIYVVSSKNEDIREIAKNINTAFSGKGGGQSNYSQGVIEDFPQDALIDFIEKVLKK